MKYSNCFIEALKAKLRDLKNTHIICLYPKINTGHWHFLWVKGDRIYHYEDKCSEGCSFLFNGSFKEDSFDSFEALILRKRLKAYARNPEMIVKYARKCRFPSVSREGFLNWSRYWPQEGLNDKPVENKICKLVMVKTRKSRDIKVIKITDFDKKNYEYADWKYVSPYCQEWMLYGITER